MKFNASTYVRRVLADLSVSLNPTSSQSGGYLTVPVGTVQVGTSWSDGREGQSAFRFGGAGVSENNRQSNTFDALMALVLGNAGHPASVQVHAGGEKRLGVGTVAACCADREIPLPESQRSRCKPTGIFHSEHGREYHVVPCHDRGSLVWRCVARHSRQTRVSGRRTI